MISCIICSRYPDISTELKNNIATTIGCEYELVIIDNSKNEYSIFSAYNEGVRRSQGDILCFMHEDILYHTIEWGRVVENYFMQYPQACLLGVAGTHYLSPYPGGWWETELSSVNLIQGYNINNKYTTDKVLIRTSHECPSKVAAIDGLWMVMSTGCYTKTNIKWDEDRFSGFHGYDLDMSLQVWNAGYEVHMIWDVLIEHKSEGKNATGFQEVIGKIWKKWECLLPMLKGYDMSKNEQSCRNRLVEVKIQARQKELDVRSSYTYRMGKYITKPLRIMRKMLNINLKYKYENKKEQY